MKKLPVLFALLLSPFALKADISQIQQLVSSQNFGQALKSVERLLETKPKDKQALFLKAVALQQLGRDDDAIATYKQLNKQAPSLPEPYNNLAVLYAKQGKQLKAREALINAINTHKSYATAYKNLSNIYQHMAADAYSKALAIDKTKQQSPVLALATINQIDKEPKLIVAAAEIPLVKKLPAVEKAKATTPVRDDSRLIINTINGWSNAWSAQDSDAYLSYYASEFIPPRGVNRTSWEQERRIRLKKPRFIRIKIKSPRVKMLSSTSAMLSFNQDYQSDRFNDAVQKTLLLKKINGRWKILKELTSS